jgi:hypothetical protein
MQEIFLQVCCLLSTHAWLRYRIALKLRNWLHASWVGVEWLFVRPWPCLVLLLIHHRRAQALRWCRSLCLVVTCTHVYNSIWGLGMGEVMALRTERHLGKHLRMRNVILLLWHIDLLLIEWIVKVASLVLTTHVKQFFTAIVHPCGIHRGMTSRLVTLLRDCNILIVDFRVVSLSLVFRDIFKQGCHPALSTMWVPKLLIFVNTWALIVFPPSPAWLRAGSRRPTRPPEIIRLASKRLHLSLLEWSHVNAGLGKSWWILLWWPHVLRWTWSFFDGRDAWESVWIRVLGYVFEVHLPPIVFLFPLRDVINRLFTFQALQKLKVFISNLRTLPHSLFKVKRSVGTGASRIPTAVAVGASHTRAVRSGMRGTRVSSCWSSPNAGLPVTPSSAHYERARVRELVEAWLLTHDSRHFLK